MSWMLVMLERTSNSHTYSAQLLLLLFTVCPAGYAFAAAAMTCTPCSGDTYNPLIGTSAGTTCTACTLLGQVPSADRTTCTCGMNFVAANTGSGCSK